MKPKPFTGAALAIIGLALATGCAKNANAPTGPTLPPVVTPDPQPPTQPYGTSSGEGYAEVWDEMINGATTSVEVTEWGGWTYGEHNQVETAVGDDTYVMVGGGSQTSDPNGNPAAVDAVLTADYPLNDGTFSTFVADNKDHGNIFYNSDLYTYVIGIRLYGPGHTLIPRSTLLSHMYLVDAESISAEHPSETISVPSQYDNRILSGGALDDYGSGYGNLLVEDDWNTTSTTASGKDQKVVDYSQIYDFALAIDNNPIAGFGTLNVAYFSGFDNITTDLQTLTITVNPGWGITGVGGLSTYNSGGYGRLLYNMWAPSTSQVLISTKDQDVDDAHGTISGIVSAIQPAQ